MLWAGTRSGVALLGWLPALFVAGVYLVVWLYMRPSEFVVSASSLDIVWPLRRQSTRLEDVDQRRTMNRQNRVRAEVPTVALVGYTNAGKSTLFNALTDASVYVKDQLFATLDPTVRRLELPNGREVVLADTVGFVRDLPHELIAAFRSTLQEAREADLILHLIDASDTNRWQRVRQVNSVLAQLDADRVPQIRVYNKIDTLDRKPRVAKNRSGEGRRLSSNE